MDLIQNYQFMALLHLVNLILQLNLLKINGEIINADSIQVYKELKFYQPALLKRFSKIKHHLFGFQNVKKFFYGDWLKLAKQKISNIKKRNKIQFLLAEQVYISKL